MAALGWLLNLDFAGGTAAVSPIQVSERFTLKGIDDQKFGLVGIDNKSFILKGPDDQKFGLTGV